MKGERNSVDHICVHAVEDLAGSLEGIDDGAQSRCCEKVSEKLSEELRKQQNSAVSECARTKQSRADKWRGSARRGRKWEVERKSASRPNRASKPSRPQKCEAGCFGKVRGFVLYVIFARSIRTTSFNAWKPSR